jgi:membrane fusion protein (multidrug efflux system)
VVQRVPVRISLDPKELQAHPLRVGLSATVDVDISNKQGSALGTVSQPSIKYETNVLNQPLQEAQAATEAIVARNMAK